MADFMDAEAEVSGSDSEESENESDDGVSISGREAREPTGGTTTESESEVETEKSDIAERGDNIADEAEAGEGSDEEHLSRKKRRKKPDDDNFEDDFDDRLEDDDYDLLEENLGVKLKRNKFKRLKAIDDDSDEEGNPLSEKDKIANELFAGDDDEAEERPPVSTQTWRKERDEFASESDSDSEQDDFIVDDNGVPIRNSYREREGTFLASELRQAEEIFGPDFDLDMFRRVTAPEQVDDEDEMQDEDRESDGSGSESEEESRKTIPKRKAVPKARITQVFEPAVLELAGITDEAERIRLSDMPERYAMRSFPITPPGAELPEEARWIYNKLFSEREYRYAKKRRPAEPDPREFDAGVNETDDANSVFAVAPSVINGTEVPGVPRTELNLDLDLGNDDDSDTEDSSRKMPPPPVPKIASQVLGDDEDWGANPSAEVAAGSKMPTPAPSETAAVPRVANRRQSLAEDDDDSDVELDCTIRDINYSHTFSAKEKKYADEYRRIVETKIAKVIGFIRQECYEVPFIYLYRKEVIVPEITYTDLWDIYELDEKFCRLFERKQQLLRLFQNMQAYQDSLTHSEKLKRIEKDELRLLNNADIHHVEKLASIEEIYDLHSFFSLYYGEDIPHMKEMLKRKNKELQRAVELENSGLLDEEIDMQAAHSDEDSSNKRSRTRLSVCGLGSYRACRKNGIGQIIRLFGLSPEQFGENLLEGYMKYELNQCSEDVLEVAKLCISTRWSDPHLVRDAAQFMMAMQISRDVNVRKAVRGVFQKNATITVRPTKKGFIHIDENHPASALKYLTNKPVQGILMDDFLKLNIAEKDGLITIEVGKTLKGLNGPSYLQEAIKLFSRDEFGALTDSWNSLRSDAITYAFEKVLYPEMWKELRHKLLEVATKHVIGSCRSTLFDYLKVAPYKVEFPDKDDEDWSTLHGIRVLAFSYTECGMMDAVLLTEDGLPSEMFRFRSMTRYGYHLLDEEDFNNKVKEMEQIQELILDRRPHVLVVGGECRTARAVQFDLIRIIRELQQDNPNAALISVEIMNPDPATVYATSSRAQEEFPDISISLRKAISLGRRLQEPLLELSQLYTRHNEILLLRLHDLQAHVPKDRLLYALELEFINRTCEVGVDFNQALGFFHKSNVLQFVCGLGFHKAAHILRVLRSKNRKLENRFNLVTEFGLGQTVFMNCGGFIRLDVDALSHTSESFLEYLDKTRVHPEMYEHARKIAVEALDLETDDLFVPGAVEEIMSNPENLLKLDLEKYNDYLMNGGGDDKLVSLEDCRLELYTGGFKDKRCPYESLDRDQIFYMLAKETPESLSPGKLCVAYVTGYRYRKPDAHELETDKALPEKIGSKFQCKFCKNMDFKLLSDVWDHFDTGSCPGSIDAVRVRLNNGISGIITLENFSDTQPVVDIERRVTLRQPIHCRIISVDPISFSAECTCKTSELMSDRYRPRRNMHYDLEAEKRDIWKYQSEAEAKGKQPYLRRLIHHSFFKNVSYQEAETLLESMDQGDVIFRPSSKGVDHLTASWKVTQGITQHIDILEKDKEHDFSLGKSLQIEEMDFEDFDEIVARYITPMAAFARDVLNYKYYQSEDYEKHEAAETYLAVEQSINPRKSHYVLSASRKFPGKFVLSYMPKTKACQEYFTVTYQGFRYRQQYFPDLQKMIDYFKRNFGTPFPTPAQSNSNVVTPASSTVTSDTNDSEAASATPGFPFPQAPSVCLSTYGALSILGSVTPGGYRSIPPLPLANNNSGSMSTRSTYTPINMSLTNTPNTNKTPIAPSPMTLTPGSMSTRSTYTPINMSLTNTPNTNKTPIAPSPMTLTPGGSWTSRVPYLSGSGSVTPGNNPTTPLYTGSIAGTPGHPLYSNISLANIPLPPSYPNSSK